LLVKAKTRRKSNLLTHVTEKEAEDTALQLRERAREARPSGRLVLGFAPGEVGYVVEIAK
jgi:hypothetical protein